MGGHLQLKLSIDICCHHTDSTISRGLHIDYNILAPTVDVPEVHCDDESSQSQQQQQQLNAESFPGEPWPCKLWVANLIVQINAGYWHFITDG